MILHALHGLSASHGFLHLTQQPGRSVTVSVRSDDAHTLAAALERGESASVPCLHGGTVTLTREGSEESGTHFPEVQLHWTGPRHRELLLSAETFGTHVPLLAGALKQRAAGRDLPGLKAFSGGTLVSGLHVPLLLSAPPGALLNAAYHADDPDRWHPGLTGVNLLAPNDTWACWALNVTYSVPGQPGVRGRLLTTSGELTGFPLTDWPAPR